ncbi:hypothetical protein JG687_00013537 [Phytophthora cactorum]|uniref:Uncharacterized protein n=1 Tax=Phytophthora cactorum TaxID=29920 RepID=A0A8T1TYN9_9STRA|nr:hypothetical protein PC120_g14357 [Phytophthora cactorum]KAG3047182.1 hypothetical protein PC121_g20218 [Phytophthora cactorum]KAG4043169.1 hypothetical protein PC123_g21358 [Phytophthora cactorum]KAG6951546.1 hypothetical protein JG687_00013537 [Phytophthora cactorum]
MICHVDDVGFFADIAKGNVEYERGDNDKIYKVEPHVKKRKVSHDLQLQSVKHKINAPPSDKTSKAVTDDVIMEPESKEAGGAEQARKSITSTKNPGAWLDVPVIVDLIIEDTRERRARSLDHEGSALFIHFG